MVLVCVAVAWFAFGSLTLLTMVAVGRAGCWEDVQRGYEPVFSDERVAAVATSSISASVMNTREDGQVNERIHLQR